MKTKLEDRTKKRKYLQDNIKTIEKRRNKKENKNIESIFSSIIDRVRGKNESKK